jgi:hypothetical protein
MGQRVVQSFGVVVQLRLVAAVENLTAHGTDHEMLDVTFRVGPLA